MQDSMDAREALSSLVEKESVTNGNSILYEENRDADVEHMQRTLEAFRKMARRYEAEILEAEKNLAMTRKRIAFIEKILSEKGKVDKRDK